MTTSAPHRVIDLIGSIQATGPREAMTWALEEFGDDVTEISDGECGDRSSWVVSQDQRYRQNPMLKLVRDGDWSDYEHMPRYKVRPGAGKNLAASLDLQYAEHAIPARPLLSEVTALTMTNPKRLLVGVPSPLDTSIFALGPLAGVRHRRAFRDATANQVRIINANLGPDIAYQLELPIETVMAIKADGLPKPARHQLHLRLASAAHRFVRQTPRGTRWKVHLCCGDLGGKPVTRLTSTRPIVEFLIVLIDGWPVNQPLEVVHAPFGHGDQAPSMNAAFYDPMIDLRGMYPEFSAGIAHHLAGDGDQQHLLRWIERRMDRRVRIATWCGLGRLKPETAGYLASRCRTLSMAA